MWGSPEGFLAAGWRTGHRVGAEPGAPALGEGPLDACPWGHVPWGAQQAGQCGSSGRGALSSPEWLNPQVVPWKARWVVGRVPSGSHLDGGHWRAAARGGGRAVFLACGTTPAPLAGAESQGGTCQPGAFCVMWSSAQLLGGSGSAFPFHSPQ